jgi:hypothetical protein
MIDRNSEYPDNFSIIIGAMKSGTTSLFEILAQHPEICGARKKELDYFAKDNAGDNSEYYAFWDWNQEGHSIALEASVAYAKSPHIVGVPARMIASGIGRIRLIYLLRDPIKRIESQVRHGVFAGWGKSLDEGIPLDALSFSSYAYQLEQYLPYFIQDEIYVVTLEEFKSNPELVLKKICKFLDVDETFRFTNANEVRNSGDFFNAPQFVSSMTQSAFGQFIAQHMLPPKYKDLIRRFLSRKPTVSDDGDKESGRWKLSSAERDEVLEKLSDELSVLKSKFDVDVDKYWNVTKNGSIDE